MYTKKTVLVDIFGVIERENGIYTPAINHLSRWVKEGKNVLLLSNSRATNEEMIAKLHKQGVFIGVHYTNILTSGQLALDDIVNGKLTISGNKFFVLGSANNKNPEKIPAIFAKSPSYQLVETLEKADFVYCGTPMIDGQYQINADAFIPQLKKIALLKKPMLCVNPDRITNYKGTFVIRQGTLAKIYEEMGGPVVYYGKPDPRIFDEVLTRNCPDVDKKNVVMIGDTCYTDARGAHRAGIKVILTLEGGVTEHEMKQLGLDLDAYLDTLPEADIPDDIIMSL